MDGSLHRDAVEGQPELLCPRRGFRQPDLLEPRCRAQVARSAKSTRVGLEDRMREHLDRRLSRPLILSSFRMSSNVICKALETASGCPHFPYE
jgi:hypothetical protein